MRTQADELMASEMAFKTAKVQQAVHHPVSVVKKAAFTMREAHVGDVGAVAQTDLGG